MAYMLLLDVTEQCHTSQDPVVWVGCVGRGGGSAHTDCCDVGEVCALRLLVHRAEVELGVPQVVRRVDGI